MRMKSMYPTRHNYLADMLFLKLLPYCTFRRWRLALPGGDYRRQEVVTQIVDLVDFAGSSPSFLGRERAAVNVDVGPERRSPRYHQSCLALEVLLAFPEC